MSESVYERIKDGLGYLKLNKAEESFATLIEQARSENWDHLHFLNQLVDQEVTATRNRRLASRMRFAHLPGQRTLEEFDFAFQPSIDRKLVEDLASLRFVKEGRPVLFLGQPGCGKTHLAVALATLAVQAGYRGYFTSGADMCSSIAAAYAEGNYRLRIRTYTTPSVLVIDDVGLVPLDRAAGNAFYQVVNRRYEMRSATIVTTNRGLPSWGEVFGDPVVAAAILDRLMHRAVVFNIKGPSWRMREHQALAEAAKQ
ncbi:MAG: IS21-like element helper ATPase IstB [Actinomycetota bacterium]